MPATDLSPNVDNYFVGAGIVKWLPLGESDYRDVGNVSKFEFTSTVTRLKHYSSRVGVRIKDKDVVSQVEATVSISMDELTASNMAMAMLATESNPSDLPIMLEILQSVEQEGAFRLIGTNVTGQRVQVDLPSCLITPSGAIGLINQGTWAELVLMAEVNGNVDTGSFGRVAWGITTEIAFP